MFSHEKNVEGMWNVYNLTLIYYGMTNWFIIKSYTQELASEW